MSEQALDPQRQEQARAYARKTRQLFLAEILLGVAFLLVLLLSGLSTGLRDLLEVAYLARVALYFIIILLCYTLVFSPLTVYSDYILPRRYGLSCQSWKSWLADKVKETILGLVLATGLIVVIYICLQSFPQTWWLLAFAFFTLFSILLTGIAPVLILPLFFKLEPLPDTDLRHRLLELAERCQTSIKDVSQINLSSKTPAGNAMLMGWGKTRCIAVGDTLIQSYAPEEIEVVMAHELGHHQHRDVPKTLVIQSVLILIGFYIVNVVLNWVVPLLDLNSISDVAALPLLILVFAIFSIIIGPLIKAYTRYIEEAADKYALTVTENPKAFASMLTKLTDQNLQESNPSKWMEFLFYDHPPYYKRLALAQPYQSGEAA